LSYKESIKSVTKFYKIALCNELCNRTPMCEFCLDGLGLSRIWMGTSALVSWEFCAFLYQCALSVDGLYHACYLKDIFT